MYFTFQQYVEERMAGTMKNILLYFSFLDLQELVNTIHLCGLKLNFLMFDLKCTHKRAVS